MNVDDPFNRSVWLTTGLASVVSVIIAVWCVTGLRTSHGSSVLLALFILLTLVGGGVGYILFFVPMWAYSTRMRRPLGPMPGALMRGARRWLAASWPVMLFLAAAFFLIGPELSVFGSGSLMIAPDRLLRIDWSILLASFVFVNIAYVGAMLRDIAPTHFGAFAGGGDGRRCR